MVVLVLALAAVITAYVGWLMWNAPDSPPRPATSRRAQLRAMKQRLAAVMNDRPGESSAQWSFGRPSTGRS